MVSARGLDRAAERAFVNINTPQDYRLWKACGEDADAGRASRCSGPGEKDLLETLGADLASNNAAITGTDTPSTAVRVLRTCFR